MMDDPTQLLNRSSDGGRISADQLLPLVYQKLRQVAAEKMTHESAGHTLQATALVHEAWLRVGGEAQGWQNRWHFFSAAAEAMRRIRCGITAELSEANLTLALAVIGRHKGLLV